MTTHVAILTILGSAGIATADNFLNPVSAYAFKDLTVTSLLGVAVVYLYRELTRLQKAREQEQESLREFVNTQTAAMMSAAEKHEQAADRQVKAFAEMASGLKDLKQSNDAQLSTYKETINRLVNVALADRTASKFDPVRQPDRQS